MTQTANGTWQYQVAGSGTWVNFGVAGTMLPTNALLLDGNDLVRFVPNRASTAIAALLRR